MTPHQQALLLSSMRLAGIRARSATGDELAIVCPRCSETKGNNRPTLYLNVKTCRWLCHRCSPRQAGRDLDSLLRLLRLEHLGSALSSVLPDPGEGLTDIKRRLLAFSEPVASEQKPEARLPLGFRRDWHSTITGRCIYRYLTEERRLTNNLLDRFSVGYMVRDPLPGCAVFPVCLNDKLQFVQARHVLFSQTPKYETFPFGAKKSHVLYGYDQLVGDRAVIVEGIFDALNLTGHGYPAVALLGKTLSAEQIRLLAAKGVGRVTVMLDGDAKLASKYLVAELERKLWTAKQVTAASLPKGKDPAVLTPQTIRELLL